MLSRQDAHGAEAPAVRAGRAGAAHVPEDYGVRDRHAENSLESSFDQEMRLRHYAACDRCSLVETNSSRSSSLTGSTGASTTVRTSTT